MATTTKKTGNRRRSAQEEDSNTIVRQRLSQLERSVSAGIWEMDENRRDLYWSDQFRKLLNLSKAKPSARMRVSKVHPEDRAIVKEATDTLFEKGKAYCIEHRVALPGKKLRWLRSTGRLVKEGGRSKLCGVVVDITHEKQVEAEVTVLKQRIDKLQHVVEIGKQGHERYQSLYNNTPIMMHSIDDKGRLVMVSDYWLHTLGYRREEVLGRPSIDFLTEESREMAKKVYLPGFYKTGKTLNAEYQFVTKKGAIIDALLSANADRDSNGKLIRSLAVITDITDKKDALRRLAASELRNSMLIRHSLVGILFGTPDGTILTANPEACRILGYTEEELKQIGREGILDMTSSYNRDQAIKRNVQGRVSGEFKVKCKSGSQLDVYMTSVVFQNHDGEENSSIIFTDITERKKAEEEIRNSHAKLDAYFKSTTDSIVLINRKYEVVDFNKVAMHLARSLLTVDLVVGLSVREVVHPAAWSLVKTNLDRALSGEVVTQELEIPYPNGDRIWWLVKYTPMLDAQRNVVGVAFNSTNINESKRVAQRLVNLTNNIPDGLLFEFVTNSDGTNPRFTFLSQGTERMLEESPGKILADIRQGIGLVHPDDKKTVFKKVLQSVLTLTPFDFDFRIVTKSGQTKWLRTRSRPYRNQMGEVVIEGINLDVTRQKVLELEQAASESKMRSILDNMINGVVVVDVKGSITYANQSATRILDMDADDLNAKTLRDYSGKRIDLDGNPIPDNKSILAIPLLERRPVSNSRHGLIKPNGNIQWIKASSAPLTDESGVLYGAVASFEDITQSLAMERSLVQSEERLRKLSENIPSGALYQATIVNGERAFTFFSTGIERIIGLSAEEILSDASLFYAQVHPDDIHLLQPGNQSVFVNLDFFDQELRFIHRDKSIHWVQMRSKVRWVEGSALRDGFIVDITERKNAELAQRESEELFRTLTGNLIVGILLQGINDEILFSNEAACNLLGVTQDQLMGKSSFDPDWRVIHEDGSPYLPEHRPSVEALKTGKKVTGKPMGVYRPMLKDWVWLLVSAVPLLDPVGATKQVIVSLADITQEKQYQKQLLDSINEKEMLIKEIHHRIKNNLQLISSILYLKMLSLEDETIKNFLSETRHKIKSVALIHERLLQTGSVNSVDIADYLGKLIDDLRITNTRPGLNLTIIEDIQSGQLGLDLAINCGLIINEIVTNSIKHAFKGRSRGSIEIALSLKGEGRELSVRDDGIPLPEGIEPGKSDTFGMQLLEIFIKQLRGQMEISRVGGTAYRIRF